MVKFIIEVSEDYIRNHAEFEEFTKSVEENGTSGFSALRSLAKMIAFKVIDENVDNEKKVFYIRREDFSKKFVSVYDELVGDVCMAAHVAGQAE